MAPASFKLITCVIRIEALSDQLAARQKDRGAQWHSKGLILASGNGAHVNLDLSTINGGTLKTSAGGEIAVEFAPVTLRGVTIAASSLIEATAGGTLTLNNGTISAGAVIETNGGAAIISGVITNGGTLFAAGAGNLVEIVSGAVINGGVALIGDGIVDIAGSSGETIKFLSNGSGALEIADMPGHASAFSGSVTGFGGSDHSNHAQFIDLTQVVSSAGVITSRYVSANSGNTSGTLFVSSGGTLVAAIKMVGNYSAGNFVITSGNGGTVAITDPGVANGGSVNPGAAPAFDAHSGIIALGAQTTLAYGEDGAGIGGTLTVGDGRHAAVITLLGNYMAGAFVTAADGPGATALSETEQTEQRPLLTHPQA